jgi:hypothetical protein
MMDKRPELYPIQDPEAPVKRAILHLKGIRSAVPATPHPVGRPWPRQVDLRDYLRRRKTLEF